MMLTQRITIAAAEETESKLMPLGGRLDLNLHFLVSVLCPLHSSSTDLQRRLIKEESGTHLQAPCRGSGGSYAVCAENSGGALSLHRADQPTVQHPGCRPDCFAGLMLDSTSQSACECRSS